MVSGFGESRDLVLSPSRSDLVVQSCYFFCRVANREIYNLSMVSGPVLLKIKGQIWISVLLASKSENKLKTIDEIGQFLVSGALDRNNSIRKTAAGLFAQSGPAKTQKNREKSKFSPDFSPFFLWTLRKSL